MSALEHEIDQKVYALCGLTPEEIAIVEGKGKTSTPASLLEDLIDACVME